MQQHAKKQGIHVIDQPRMPDNGERRGSNDSEDIEQNHLEALRGNKPPPDERPPKPRRYCQPDLAGV